MGEGCDVLTATEGKNKDINIWYWYTNIWHITYDRFYTEYYIYYIFYTLDWNVGDNSMVAHFGPISLNFGISIIYVLYDLSGLEIFGFHIINNKLTCSYISALLLF